MQEVVDSQDLINTISKLEKLEEEKRELADVTKEMLTTKQNQKAMM